MFINYSGANLLNGIASAIIMRSSLNGNLNSDYAIFEVDENTLPLFLAKIEPDYLIGLNLFRDQLDRYGEVNTIAQNWKRAYQSLKKTVLILNADDPQIAYLGNQLNAKVYYFGLNDKRFATVIKQQTADSLLCPKCGAPLHFEVIYFSHLGKWKCLACGLERPNLSLQEFGYYPLFGTYAIYDTLAAVLTAQMIGLSEKQIIESLKVFQPAFGRQEIMVVENKKIQLFLSKNPTSFNESLKTINSHYPKNLLLVLNDRIPDGTDVSWIWDIDFERLLNDKINLYLAGDRVYDLALRIKYIDQKSKIKNQKSTYRIFEDLKDAIQTSLNNTDLSETLYVLPTYSAMLEVRKILTGKKIL